MTPDDTMKPAPIATPGVDPTHIRLAAYAYDELQRKHDALRGIHEDLKRDHESLKTDHSALSELVRQAAFDSKAFINQCDREGIGMATVVDHRGRVEKFIAKLQKNGRAL